MEGRTPGLLLEALFVAESTLDAHWRADRFLPPTPVRVVVDLQGAAVQMGDLSDRLQPVDSAQWAALDIPLGELLSGQVQAARQIAEDRAHAIADEAHARMLKVLQPQAERLVELARIHPTVGDSEPAACRTELAALSEGLRGTRVRLDALRWISSRGLSSSDQGARYSTYLFTTDPILCSIPYAPNWRPPASCALQSTCPTFCSCAAGRLPVIPSVPRPIWRVPWPSALACPSSIYAIPIRARSPTTQQKTHGILAISAPSPSALRPSPLRPPMPKSRRPISCPKAVPSNPSDVDRHGVRIGVYGRSAYGLRPDNPAHAELVKADSVDASFDAFIEEGLDTLAGLRPPDQRRGKPARFAPARRTVYRRAAGHRHALERTPQIAFCAILSKRPNRAV